MPENYQDVRLFMSDIESLFLAIYPLWPKAMLAKFVSLMSFEVSKFNPAINREIIKTYESLGVNQKINIFPGVVNTGSILTPTNSSKISKVYYGKEILRVSWARSYSSAPSILGPDLTEYKSFQGEIIYDNRIFKSVSTSIGIDYADTETPYSYSYLSFMSYSSEFIQPVLSYPFVFCNVVLNAYSGAETVLAMIENGVAVEADKNLLKDFVICINAYKKYGGQLAAANSLQAEKHRQALADYKSAANEKLAQRKNELADMKTQITFAAKNETNSAKRDMQNLMLSAQSLMIQLQGRLK